MSECVIKGRPLHLFRGVAEGLYLCPTDRRKSKQRDSGVLLLLLPLSTHSPSVCLRSFVRYLSDARQKSSRTVLGLRLVGETFPPRRSRRAGSSSLKQFLALTRIRVAFVCVCVSAQACVTPSKLNLQQIWNTSSEHAINLPTFTRN